MSTAGETILVVGTVERTIVLPERTTETLQVAAQGIAGSNATVISYTAGESLGGHRAVVIESGEAFYASNDTPSHKNAVIGITTGAAAISHTVSIRTFGEIVEPSWSWVEGLPIYLSTNGQLTQTVPTSGFQLQLGYAITDTSMFININTPIVLL